MGAITMSLHNYRWGFKKFDSGLIQLRIATALTVDPRRSSRGWYTYVEAYDRDIYSKPILNISRVTTRLKNRRTEGKPLRDKKLWLTEVYKLDFYSVGYGHKGPLGTPEYAEPAEYVQATLESETIRVRPSKPTERNTTTTKWPTVEFDKDAFYTFVQQSVAQRETRPFVDWLAENIPDVASLILECGNLPEDEFHAVNKPTRCVFD